MLDSIELKACEDCINRYGFVSEMTIMRRLKCTPFYARQIVNDYHNHVISVRWSGVVLEMANLAQNQAPAINNFKTEP